MHHAYIYFGALSALPVLVSDARVRFQFGGEHNPDVQVREFERFGVDEARALRDTAALRSLSGRALYIVGVSTLTSEAQQALLKLFEEPQAGAVFILLAPHGSVIATLRSRMLPYPVALDTVVAKHSAKVFLSAPQKERSTMVVKLLKEDEGVRERVRDFLQALEAELHTTIQTTKPDKALVDGLGDIAKVRGYANDRSPSFKMLLEHLSLSLPTL